MSPTTPFSASTSMMKPAAPKKDDWDDWEDF